MICSPRPRSARFPIAALFSCVLLALALLPGTALAASSTIVISQVYGGGGNAGATLKNDFIELYNLGGSTVDVSGWLRRQAPPGRGRTFSDRSPRATTT